MKSNNIAPRGWQRDQVQRRFADIAAPSTYNEDEHSVEAVLSTGADVVRSFGVERLSITPEAVDLTRIAENAVPLLDSHNSTSIKTVLGRVSRVWFSGGNLLGKLVFAATPQGRSAEQMVARREVSSISIGYSVSRWRVFNGDGEEIDPATQRINFDDDLVFEAARWQLAEASLCSLPADPAASTRSFINTPHNHRAVENALVRMRMRNRAAGIFCDDPRSRERALARMQARQRMFDRMTPDRD